jgi:hypothetical protein
MLNQLKSEIMNKWIQNEKSQFSSDLNCNLEKNDIKLIFSQESPALYRIVSFQSQIVSYVSCTDFAISPMLGSSILQAQLSQIIKSWFH